MIIAREQPWRQIITAQLTPNRPSPDKAPILCDLDGVVWLMHEPIVGSVEAVAALRNAGHRVLFVTNNSSATIVAQEEFLANIGIEASHDVCTSAHAAGMLLREGERVLVAAGLGVVESVLLAGAVIVGRTDDGRGDEKDVDVETVVVGYHNTFDYAGMTRAAAAVRRGARLIATNDDATYPTPAGLIPGGGSILAAIVTASGVQPIIAGKPHVPMGDYVRRVLQQGDLSQAWMVGDRDLTDGAFARTLGCQFALVLSGVSDGREASPAKPNLVCSNLLEFATLILG